MELIPSETRHLVAPLSGESQKFNDATVWGLHLSRGNNDSRQLFVGEDLIATDLPIVRVMPSAGEKSIIARPTHHLKKVFSVFKSL